MDTTTIHNPSRCERREKGHACNIEQARDRAGTISPLGSGKAIDMYCAPSNRVTGVLFFHAQKRIHRSVRFIVGFRTNCAGAVCVIALCLHGFSSLQSGTGGGGVGKALLQAR